MPFDPENSSHLAQLNTAVEWSDGKLNAFRKNRMQFIRQTVGKHYGENGSSDRVPIPMIAIGTTLFHRQMVSPGPQALITTKIRDLEPGAADLTLVTNHRINEMNLQQTISDVALESLYSISVVKVGISVDGTPSQDGDYVHDPGEFFMDVIEPEDLILDMSARRYGQIGYIGNRFRVPLDWARDNPQFDRKLRGALQASDSEKVADLDAEDRAESLTRGSGFMIEEYIPHIDLMELWLPKENMVLTFSSTGGPPLRVIERRRGARPLFRFPRLITVPGNIMPLPVVALWMDLHEATNNSYNKAVRQCDRQKTVTGVQGNAKDDGQRVLEANDGDMILLDNPSAVAEFSTGGQSQSNLAMAIWSKDMLDWAGGNWSSIGGLAAQSDTVGQDKLLADNASQAIQHIQDAMREFTKELTMDVAYEEWHNPLSKVRLQKPIGNTGYSVPIEWNPERRMGDFLDYNFDCNPYSRRSRSPQERINEVTGFVTKILLPIMPDLAQNGKAIDWEAFFKLFADYADLPEINRLITYMQGEQYPGRTAEQGSGGGKPTDTTRRYVRENRPAGTQQGKDQALIQTLMGGNPQSSEMAGLLRPAS